MPVCFRSVVWAVALAAGPTHALAQTTDPALVARARAIHDRVITLDTHDDIDPRNFTKQRNYTQRLDNQVNLPKMEEGGLDVAFFIVSALLVLELAVVGTGAGPQNLELLEGLKRLVGLPVYAGGGVRSAEDLKLLEDAGCDAALVGSAIHSGAIAPPG